VTNPFRWQTKPWDEEIGMYYSRARYYEAGTGRFVGVDPAMSVEARLQGTICLKSSSQGSAAMATRYLWPGVNPCNVADPTGMGTVSCLICAACAVTLGGAPLVDCLSQAAGAALHPCEGETRAQAAERAFKECVRGYMGDEGVWAMGTACLIACGICALPQPA